MSEAALWTVILGGMLATYTMRLSFFALIPDEGLPGWLRRSRRYVPPAVLSAILLPEVLQPADVLDLSLGNHRLLASLVAGLVAWRTKNTWLTILAGMAMLILLDLGLG